MHAAHGPFHAAVSKATLAGCAGLSVILLAGCNPSKDLQDGRPTRRVELPDGRAVNINCTGRGSPTVILESGFGADSRAWAPVQPAIARMTRVCAYDRAGYGFSSPGPLPRSAAAIASDLEQALQAGEIAGPYILVGHSAGGLYARVFAARHRKDVAGLILLDPTIEHLIPAQAEDGLEGIRRRLERCLETAGDEGLAAADGPCHMTPGLTAAGRTERWRNRLSELNAIFGPTSLEVSRIGRLLEDIPAYIVTASETAASSPVMLFPEPRSVWELQHQSLMLRFRHGSQRTVLSSHLIMSDRPEVVIQATRAMVEAARAQRPPVPLPPSETGLAGSNGPADTARRDSFVTLRALKSLLGASP